MVYRVNIVYERRRGAHKHTVQSFLIHAANAAAAEAAARKESIEPVIEVFVEQRPDTVIAHAYEYWDSHQIEQMRRYHQGKEVRYWGVIYRVYRDVTDIREGWLKSKGKLMRFAAREGAETEAARLMAKHKASPHSSTGAQLQYWAEELVSGSTLRLRVSASGLYL
jgi:hypothetical protein